MIVCEDALFYGFLCLSYFFLNFLEKSPFTGQVVLLYVTVGVRASGCPIKGEICRITCFFAYDTHDEYQTGKRTEQL
jgi:hypothetical protein